MLALYESVLLGLECAEAAQLLAHLPEDMDTEKYFQAIATIKLVPPKLWHPVPQTKGNALERNIEPNSTSFFVRKLFTF